MTADTITASHLHLSYHGLQTPPKGTTAETSFGTTHLQQERGYQRWTNVTEERRRGVPGKSCVAQNLQP